MSIPRIRYAGLVWLLGLAVALLPGLSEQVQGVVGSGSLWVALVMAAAKLVREMFVQVRVEDPMEYHTMQRNVAGFWERVL